MAIISELDTFYGRALPTAFREQCDLADFTKLDLENRQLSAPWIHNYRYLRGLDGRLPGDEKDKKSGDSSSKEEQKQHPGARPDGHDQTDSLLRLAAQLQSDDRKQRALGKPGFRAIGILGSDIYDKLLILRALRPMFPGVVFFTHTLDAELAQPEEWKATHNLVVISGFGLRLHDLWQRNIPPFRDGSQTAVYLGTLVAAGEISHDDPAGPDEASRHPLQKIIDVPRVFEIGRNGALDLSVNTVGAVWTKRGMSNAQLEEKDAGGSLITRIHPLRTDLRQWWSFYVLHSTILGTWPVPLSLGLCALFSLVFIVLFYRALVLVRTETLLQEDDDAGEYFIVTWLKKIVPRERFGGQALHRICGMTVTPWWKLLNRWFTLSTPIMSVAAALLAVLVVTIGYRWQWTYGEPFAWFAGLSIWPGVAIRVFALVLAIHFVFRSYCRVLRSDSEIFERFKLGRNRHECASATEPDRHWRHTFAPWTVPLKMEHRPAGLDPALPFQDKSFIAGDLWCQYIWRGWWPYRLVRVVALTTLFLFTTWCAFAAFDCGLPPSPTRSGLAAAMDRDSMSLLLIAAVFLTLFVVDALWLNSSFIRLFTSGLTRWPGDVLRRVPGSEVLEESEIAEDLDLRLIATRTEAIGEFVLYPFVIVALLIVSRAPYFDNWGWTNGLILILAALLGIAVVSALRIRAAAEEARQAALSRLRTAHAVASAETGMDAPLKVRVLNEMIARITAVHEGAFAPFSHQPIIKALLFPAGGIGVWELVMRVLNR